MIARTMDIIYDVLRIYKGTYPGVRAHCTETKMSYVAELQWDDGDVSAIYILKKIEE